ncbi:MAG: PAS domain S-box protein [Alphaproteobacteria bacterium]|uniref:histidine kinase n=1 Tax=Candidatus Nitrobium versatile TaxID=2884831 RepID=A0A953M3G5_9BACT|nr:PAS domain S-box protein [Candidatus Nitrobium versatile]
MKNWILKKKCRIVLFGILIVAVPLAGLAFFVNFAVTAAIEGRIIRETQGLSKAASHNITRQLEGNIRLAELFATRPLLLSALKTGNKTEMSHHLRMLVGNGGLIERAFIASGKGVELAACPEDPSAIGKNFSHRDWYKGISKNWSPYVSDFYLRAGKPQRYLFAIVVPIRVAGQVKGILVLQPNADYIKEALSSIEVGEGRIHLVDKKGSLIYRSGSIVDKTIDFTDYPMVPKLLKGLKGVENIIDPEYKKPLISAYYPIKEYGWGVIVDKPMDVVLAPVRKLNEMVYAISGLMLLLGGVLAYGFSKMFIAQKKSLEERDRVFNYSLDMLCVAGFDGYFKQLNPAYEKTLGWSNEELMSKPFLDFVHPEDRDLTVEAAASLSGGRPIKIFQNRYLCRDGSYKWLSWSSYPLVEEKAIFAVARDITRHKELEDQNAQRAAQLEDANSELLAMNEEVQAMNEELQNQQKELTATNMRLQTATRAKSDFLANMSHELRTPLNSIIGFSELLQDELYGKLNEKQKEYIADVLDSGKHLLQLINDILDLSKVESGKMELELSNFVLKDVLNAAMIMLKEKAMKHSLQLELEISSDADIDIEADERKFKQVMFNLLSNAVKFTPEGGSVSVTARIIPDNKNSINNDVSDGFVEISVADTGIGIKSEDMSKLFHEFSQIESPYTKKYVGTGLGLALTRRIVELHGGKIWAESEFGKGSRFAFSIPLRQRRISETMPLTMRQAGIANADKRRVVVIDDDPRTLEIVDSALTAEGYIVTRASGGTDGIEAVRKEHPELIVLDLLMPGMNGFEVVDILRSGERTSEIPILILTAKDLSSEEKKRLEGKIDHIAEKGSITQESFIVEMKKLLVRE